MKDLKYFVRRYLEERPMFLSLIRSTEALLFTKLDKYLVHPILDFGAGDGFFTHEVFGNGKIDIGIDLDNSRLAQIKTNKVYKNIAFYDGTKLPFKNNYFGSVVSNCVLEHITSLPKSIKEVNRVIKPGGFFITSVMTNKWEDYLFFTKIIGVTYKKYLRKIQEHHNLLNSTEWINLFERNGFEVVNTQGYLSPNTCKLLDISHYLSFPSILTKILLNKWVIWKNWYKLFSLDKLLLKQLDDVLLDYKESAAIFFVLRKV